jgi:uncharacterized membrane protein (UPF0127 family)
MITRVTNHLISSKSLYKARAFGHFLLMIMVFSSCQSEETKRSAGLDGRPFYELMINQTESVQIQLSISEKDQVKGLSGVKPEELADYQGMLFVYNSIGPRSFWMPDTHFDLDLFYLDQNFNVIDIFRGLKHHPGKDVPPPIPRAPTIYCWHVLELKASSPLSKKIRQFTQLTWKPGQNLPKILQDIRPQK